MSLTGSCNCGSITVVLDVEQHEATSGTSLVPLFCHCTNCRRFGGGPGVYVTITDSANVKIEDSEGALKQYVDTRTSSGKPLHRKFCGICGSPILGAKPESPDKVIVVTALFDDPPPIKAEIYCKSMKTWESNMSGVERFEKGVGGDDFARLGKLAG